MTADAQPDSASSRKKFLVRKRTLEAVPIAIGILPFEGWGLGVPMAHVDTRDDRAPPRQAALTLDDEVDALEYAINRLETQNQQKLNDDRRRTIRESITVLRLMKARAMAEATKRR